MKKPNIQDIVYNRTFPNKRQDDPPSLHAHVLRNLVPEVRVEVQTYYGALDCLEAQYPGLDYTFAAHRKRLGRYHWHRRLFRVFDELRLTKEEILSLCVWEGTRAAKERFERDTNTKIESTTLAGIAVAPRGSGPRAIFHDYPPETYDAQTPNSHVTRYSGREVSTKIETEDARSHVMGMGYFTKDTETGQMVVDGDSNEAGRFQEQWEQWMKEALERNELDIDDLLDNARSRRTQNTMATAGVSTQNGSNGESVESVPSTISHSTETISPDTPNRSRTFTNLRSILEDLRTTNDRLAADNAALATILSRTRTTEAR